MTFQKLPFLDVFKDASGGNIKTPQKEFLEEGEFPVVDQGQGLIAGFVNDRSRVCKAKPPVIVFGDHTRAIKYVDFEFAMGADGTKVLVPKVKSDTKYLFHALNAIEIPAAGYSRHYKFLKETQVPLPPLAEQKRIAGILDAADALRAKRRESLAQLDTLLQSTFLDMFGDPATNPNFRSMALTDLVTKFIDYRGKTPEKSHVGVPLITAKIVKNKAIKTPNEFIPEDSFDTRMSRGIPNPGDVIFTTEAPMGEVALVPEYKAAFGQRLLVLQPNAEKVESTYLMWALTMPFVIRQLHQRSTGSTVTGIRSKEFKKVNLLLPPINLQNRFAAIVGSVEQQKASQRAHLDELDTLFASLQSRAFRGDL